MERMNERSSRGASLSWAPVQVPYCRPSSRMAVTWPMPWACSSQPHTAPWFARPPMGPGPRRQSQLQLLPSDHSIRMTVVPSNPANLLNPSASPRLHPRQDLSCVSPSLVMGPHPSHPPSQKTSILMSISPSPTSHQITLQGHPGPLLKYFWIPSPSFIPDPWLQPERSSSRQHLQLLSHL